MTALPLPPCPDTSHVRSWDIFCRVIDNHGDLGVCWRLSADLAQRGHAVRLWVDDASALTWMAPHTERPKVEVLRWEDHVNMHQPNDVVIEAFGCALPEAVEQQLAQHPKTVWLNLEYLSAEDYVERHHGLPSPVMHGPAKGATKWFFYPGLTEGSGGLLREPDLQQRQLQFQKAAWLTQWITQKEKRNDERYIALFCYEPEPLRAWLQQLAHDPTPTCLLVTAGRAQQAVQAVLPQIDRGNDALHIEWLPYLSQTDFDHLLWACDINMVRGEDSLVRAIWAGQPWVWHIYPQDDLAHHHKLQALCDRLAMPQDLQAFQRRWNGVSDEPLSALTPDTLARWTDWSQATKRVLQAQNDLASQLIAFAAQSR